MFRLFRRKSPLDADLIDWQFEVFAWLLRNFGGMSEFEKTAFVEPTSDFFTPSVREGHKCVEDIFTSVKHYAGLDDWPCELAPGEPDLPNRAAPGLAIVHDGRPAPAGTFEINGDGSDTVTIRYKPGSEKDPVALIATLAHELAHYLTATAKEPPPGGWENWEPVTDLAAVFMGFGIFVTNSVFNFTQFQSFEEQGWQSQRLGYLTESEAVFATAIFVKLLDCDPSIADQHLKSSLTREFRRCLAHLEGLAEQLDVLRGIPR